MANKRSFGVATVSSQFKWPQRLRFTPTTQDAELCVSHQARCVTADNDGATML